MPELTAVFGYKEFGIINKQGQFEAKTVKVFILSGKNGELAQPSL
jgi:hypothetical protein